MTCSVYWIYLAEHENVLQEGYIGITTQGVEHRFKEHVALSKPGCRSIINRAILKHKSSVLVKELVKGSIEYCKLIEERLRPLDRIGWNTVKGGGKPPVFTGHSKESKVKIGAASIGNKYSLGRKHSEESKAKISLNGIGKQKKKRVRKPHSEETKAKMSASKIARDLANKLNRIEPNSAEINKGNK